MHRRHVESIQQEGPLPRSELSLIYTDLLIQNTNIVELYSRLVKDGTQLTFYNSGIGTYAKPSWKSLSYLEQVIANKLDLAFALYVASLVDSIKLTHHKPI